MNGLERKRVPSRGVEGFSLVEVVMATGVAMFALLVIFSLMPVGFSSLQESNRQIVEAEIFNALGAELAATRFDQLAAQTGARFPVYYDNEGLETGSGPQAVFTVRCELHPAELSGALRRATVSVGFRQDPADAGANVTKRSFLLADRGL